MLLRCRIALLSFLLFYSSSFAQTSQAPVSDDILEPGVYPAISFNQSFVRDYILGFGAGVHETRHHFGTKINFDFRPTFKNVTMAENDTLNIQYKVRDYFLYLSLEKMFKVSKKLMPFVQVNTGLLWGNFKGWDKSPESRFVVSPIGGLAFFPVNFLAIKAGYQYLNPLVFNTGGHRLFIQLNLIIPG